MNILYTCLVGLYDTVRSVKHELGWRYICFTDQPEENIDKSWEVVKLLTHHDSKTIAESKIYRDIKCRPHVWLPDHDMSVWIDANLEPIISLTEFVKNKDGFWLMNHPERTCVYEEAKKCIELKKDCQEVIDNQMRGYLLKSYPHNNGLSATGVIVRSYNEKNINVGEDWWRQVKYGSVRDQLSFNYVAWRHQLIFGMFPFLQGFEYHYHLHRIKKKSKKIKDRRTEAYFRLYGQHEPNRDNKRTY